jgi:hypothetical protein
MNVREVVVRNAVMEETALYSDWTDEYWWIMARDDASKGFDMDHMFQQSNRKFTSGDVKSVRGKILTQEYTEWMSPTFQPRQNEVVIARRPHSPGVALIFIRTPRYFACFAVETVLDFDPANTTEVARKLHNALAMMTYR